eukprot:4355982-Pleurochrysis_carterae.AAC.1
MVGHGAGAAAQALCAYTRSPCGRGMHCWDRMILRARFIAAYSIITVASIKPLGFYQAVIQFYENKLIVSTLTILPALAFAKP